MFLVELGERLTEKLSLSILTFILEISWSLNSMKKLYKFNNCFILIQLEYISEEDEDYDQWEYKDLQQLLKNIRENYQIPQLSMIKYIVIFLLVFYCLLIWRLFPYWFALPFLVITLYKLGQFACKFLIYPASSHLYRRHLENDIGAFFAKTSLNYLNNSIFPWIDEQIAIYTFIRDNYNISYHQLIYLLQLISLKQAPPEQVPEKIEQIKKLIDQFLLSKKSFQSLQNWYYNDTFGSLNFMRARIQIIYRAEQMQVASFDGVLIDCMLIKASENLLTSPTILFCLPNAIYYEQLVLQQEIIQYYNLLGLNLVLWNYRGCGESQGIMEPLKLQQDGIAIIDYLRQQKVQKIGIHGYSIGGSIASNIAKARLVDFLFVDRSFSSLSCTAEKQSSKLISFLLNLLVNWNQLNYKDYLAFQGPKLLSVDTNDQIIPFLASLTVGITKASFLSNKKKNSNCGNQLVLMKTVNYHKVYYFIDITEQFYYHILNKKDFLLLYSSLKRICQVFTYYEKVKKQNLSTWTAQFQGREEQNEISILSPSRSEEIKIMERSNFQEKQNYLKNLDNIPTNFVIEVYQILSRLDSLQMKLPDVFTKHSKNQQELLQVFFLICHYWGYEEQTTYRPISLQKNQAMMKVIFFLNMIIVQLRFKDFLNQIDDFLNRHEKTILQLEQQVSQFFLYYLRFQRILTSFRPILEIL